MTEITEAVDFNVAPFAADGIGTLMDKGARAYLEDYVYSPDPDGPGADHELTEFEKDMAYDFLAGLFTDERFFGPVRQALSELTRLQEEVEGLRDLQTGDQTPRPDLALGAIRVAMGVTTDGEVKPWLQTAVDFLVGDHEPTEDAATLTPGEQS